jgi:hypothetical protein
VKEESAGEEIEKEAALPEGMERYCVEFKAFNITHLFIN